jgi:Putative Zn-dependent protease
MIRARLMIGVTVGMLIASGAQAQFGDILRKIDPSRVKKSVQVAREATHEFTEDEEADIGRVVSARVLATYPLLKDEKLQRYVTLVGNTVAAYSARPTLEWHFAVLHSDIVNAFSAPGGFIFITAGALKQMHSEAELAAVLGHEIAHCTQKHILKEIKRSNVISAGVDLAQSSSNGSFLSDEMGKKVSQVAYDKLFNTGLSRSDEMEADRIGVQLADAAGYRAPEFLRFLDSLEKEEGTSAMKQFVATHPSAADRRKAVQSEVRNEHGGQVLAERWEQWTAAKR